MYLTILRDARCIYETVSDIIYIDRQVKMITIVTVCFNSESIIEETMQSVFAQTYSDKEYIIIDGKSTDCTMDIINKYKDCEYLKVVSEPDRGLYDAMNKSLTLAKGEYILFLNSGDIFCDEKVFSDMAPCLTEDIVYGNVIRKTHQGDKVEKYPGKYKLFWLLLQGKMVSHQVIFTRTDIMRKYQFDEAYKITADFNFLVRAVHDQCSLRYVERNVSVMENREGISARPENLDIMRTEDDRSLREYFPVWYYLLKPIKYIVRKASS